MQVTKEMNAMFSTKKITMILKYIVSRFSIAAFVVIVGMVGMVGSAAAANRPKPIVISTDPIDDAVDVPINNTVTVNFSLPISCKSVNRTTVEIKSLRHVSVR